MRDLSGRVARAGVVLDRWARPSPAGDPLPDVLVPAAAQLEAAYDRRRVARGWRLVGGVHYAVASADADADHAALHRNVDDAFRQFVAACREHGGPLAHVPDAPPDPQSLVEAEPDSDEPAPMSAAEPVERDASLDNRTGMRQALGRPSHAHLDLLKRLHDQGLVGPGGGRLP